MTQIKEQTVELVLPSDSTGALQKAISIIENLKSVYLEETKLLESNDSRSFLALQEKKVEAARFYQLAISQLIDRKEEIKNASPSLRQKLQELQLEFSVLSKRNMEALDRMHRCSEKLGETIRNAAIRSVQQKRSYSYGENGILNSAAQTRRITSGISETA